MFDSFWRVAKGQPYGSEPLERCRLSTVTHSCPCSAIRNAPLALLMPLFMGRNRWPDGVPAGLLHGRYQETENLLHAIVTSRFFSSRLHISYVLFCRQFLFCLATDNPELTCSPGAK